MKIGDGGIMKSLNGFLLVLFIIGTVFAQKSEMEKLLPGNNFISGWMKEDTACSFLGYAFDVTTLREIIDGGCEIYTENGFKEAIFQGYLNSTNTNERVCIDIYNQASKSNALKVFSGVVTTVGEVLKIGADTAVI
ncbi:MAG: hypothetical protein JW795_21995, partial [Chitinivibrionales bacterium]|nr:hypothetical protein [Chitinivibrionales bacterium]